MPQQLHIRWFVFGSDQGPDEKKCDKLIDMDVADSLLTLKVRAWCLRHILTLGQSAATTAIGQVEAQ